jgi:hypothetical protein
VFKVISNHRNTSKNDNEAITSHPLDWQKLGHYRVPRFGRNMRLQNMLVCTKTDEAYLERNLTKFSKVIFYPSLQPRNPALEFIF